VNGVAEPALGLSEFDGLMAGLGSFEPAPRVAVGVSGGADSLALAVLLNDWALARGGSAIGLVVDHGLRRVSAAEARHTARTLGGLGIDHRVLVWRGAKPAANLQAEARAARYRLLSGWCERQGVLHLALAHHLDDQAETVLLRLARGSGLDGLAAMAPVVEHADLRVLRPLLGVPKGCLQATLRHRGLDWIEDPSNRDPAHGRTRLRALGSALAREGLTPARLAATAGHLGRARAALEDSLGDLLARAVQVSPAGFVWLEPEPLAAAPKDLGLRALSRVLMAVGGADYGPRLERLERLHGRLRRGLDRGATLGGCRILPRGGRLLIAREPAAAPSLSVGPGARLLWDGRFRIALGRNIGAATLGPLGGEGWRQVKPAVAAVIARTIPAAARAALPALSDASGVMAVPHLGFARVLGAVRGCGFAPKNVLTPVRFTVA
jgi:tRNA(Ile)-lysidine synthase